MKYRALSENIIRNISKAVLHTLNESQLWTYERCYEEAKKFSSRVEFYEKSRSAYHAALRNHWLDDYTWFKEKLQTYPPGWWEFEDHCEEEARKYSSRSEFCQNCSGAYYAALKNHWIDNYYWFSPKNGGGPQMYWTYERCYEEAKKYHSRKEFSINNPSAYRSANRRHWLDDYTWFKEKVVWDYETCYEEAKKFSSRSEFMQKSKWAYEVARVHGWLDDYTWFKSTIKWTYETCYEIAKEFSSRKELEKKSKRAYAVALKNGWLDDYTWFKPKNSRK